MFFLTLIILFSGCDIVQQVIEDALDSPNSQTLLNGFLNSFNETTPISTTFKDAIYEADALYNFDPEDYEYQQLEIQPKSNSGGYLLKSGVYTINARSFCLRGYTHGPSRGDGHLYAPLKGKKAGFVQSILEHYGEKPEIPQQEVQSLLWGVIAGADMNSLGERHNKTLNSLFSLEELLTFQGRDWLNGFTDQQVNKFKQMALNNLSPQLQGFVKNDNQIRTMIQQNKTFRELEKVAILAGVAPAKDKIREVSKGRWSYHPNGFFVRFFPSGYAQTRVDVYVPYDGEVQRAANGKVIGLANVNNVDKEVVFNPATMVASPANQSSQRIGISPVPVSPCKDDEKLGNRKSKWQRLANEQLKKHRSTDIKNQSITCAYAEMYLKNPNRYKWAGLATIVSGKIGMEEKEKRWKPNITDLMESLMAGNKAVFDDLYWQHLAFENKGIGELKKLYCEQSISHEEYSAWKKISMGKVWEGNRDLLLHEQRYILQPLLYNSHPLTWYLSDSWGGILVNWGNVLESPVPNDDSVFPSGLDRNIANFNQRWTWIENHILPEWRKFENKPSNKPLLMQSLRESCPSIR